MQQLPQDIEAEQSVLGAMLLSADAAAEVSGILSAADFYRPAHATVFEVVKGMHLRSEPVDPITATAELRARGDLTRIGGAAYLHTLVSAVPTAANAAHYAEMVRQTAERRRIIEAATRAMQSAADATMDRDALYLAYSEIARSFEEATGHAQPRGRLIRRPFSDADPHPIAWLWEPTAGQGRIPASGLTIAAGMGGTGKSTFAVWVAARLSRGELPGCHAGTPRRVLYLAPEDDWEQVTALRLMAAGADMRMVETAAVPTDSGERPFKLPTDTRLIVDHVRTVGDFAAVILDPVMSFMEASHDAHKGQGVRGTLEPLVYQLGRLGVALLTISHFNKSNSPDPAQRLVGSTDFRNLARAMLAFAVDSDSGDAVITQDKSNYSGGDVVPSLAYRITDSPVRHGRYASRVGRFDLVGESDRTARDVLSASANADGSTAKQRRDVAEWLRGYLTEHGGEAASVDVKKAARADDIPERTLTRAMRRAEVEAFRPGFGKGSVWRLITPEPNTLSDTSQASHATVRPVAPLPESGATGPTDGADGPTSQAESQNVAELPTARCAECGGPMTVVEPGQASHPTCGTAA